MVRVGGPSIKLFHGSQVLVEPVEHLAFDNWQRHKVARIGDHVFLVFGQRAEPVEEGLRRRLKTEVRIVTAAEMQHRRIDARQEVRDVYVWVVAGIDSRLVQHADLQARLDGEDNCSDTSAPAVPIVAEHVRANILPGFEVIDGAAKLPHLLDREISATMRRPVRPR